MATVWVDPPKHEATINAANTYVLRNEKPGRVSRWLISLVSSSASLSCAVKARRAGSADTFMAVPYVKLHLNGSAGDGTQVSTAITTTSLIQVDATGMDVAVDCTSYTSGSLALAAVPVEG